MKTPSFHFSSPGLSRPADAFGFAASALRPAGAVAAAVLTESPAMGMLAGILLAQVAPDRSGGVATARLSSKAMKLAVIALGFGVQPATVLSVGAKSLPVTLGGIVLVMAVGVLLARAFGLNRVLGTLISGGTAICGGSAIAALAPTVGADRRDTAVSLAIIFLLNAVAIFLFPVIGRALDLSQAQFGLWSALAIHDTAGVVGAGAAYGQEALALGTVVKLTRALWILPVCLVVARFFHGGGRASFPWFLLGFVGAAFAGEVLPASALVWLAWGGRALMVGALFLLGCGLHRDELRVAGLRPMLCAVVLWAMVGWVSLSLIAGGVIGVDVAAR